MDNLNFLTEVKKTKDKKLKSVKEDGLYVFGGLLQNSEATNTLRVLKLG